MSDEIKVNQLPENGICKKVFKKAEEIEKSSIFQELPDKNKEYYKNETAFLLTVFDADGNGIISDEERNAVKDADYNKQLDEYNSGLPKLKLEDADITKAKLARESLEQDTAEVLNPTKKQTTPEEKVKKNLLIPFKVAASSEKDYEKKYTYLNALEIIDDLSHKTNLNKYQQRDLKNSKKEAAECEKELSPEVSIATQKKAQNEIIGEPEKNE